MIPLSPLFKYHVYSRAALPLRFGRKTKTGWNSLLNTHKNHLRSLMESPEFQDFHSVGQGQRLGTCILTQLSDDGDTGCQ